jgi:hypothetical protein
MATVEWTMQQAPSVGPPATLLPYQICFDYLNDDTYIGNSDSAPVFLGPVWVDTITAPLVLTIDPDTGGLSASMPAASSTQNGYLSAADWATFSASSGLSPATEVTSNYAILSTDSVILAAASAPLSLVLPACVNGKSIRLKKTDISTNVITITAQSGQLIDGELTYTLELPYEYVEVFSNGSHWYVMSE